MCMQFTEDLVNHILTVSLQWGTRVCTSDMLPGDAHVIVPQTSVTLSSEKMLGSTQGEWVRKTETH